MLNYYFLAYFVVFNFLGIVCLVPWLIRSGTYGPIVDSAGVSRTWWYISKAEPIPPEADNLKLT